MEYFKINYSRLENLKKIKFYKFILVVIILIVFLVILALFKDTYHKISFSGIYNNGILKITINNKLSDILKNNQYLEFNNQKTAYKIISYGDFEIINNEIYQDIELAIEKEFLNNEVGMVELYYNKQKIIKYIFELFK